LKTRVGIIDYGMGNLTSVRNALLSLGVDVEVMESIKAIGNVSHVILPGVGAFGDGMANLSKRGWLESMDSEIRQKGVPILGICLGLQLLAERSFEHGCHEGLGWIAGEVVRFESADGLLRIPHVGWNDVHVVDRSRCYREGIKEDPIVYFVHSYHLVPKDPSIVDGWCEYGNRFVASLASDAVWAVQYHPEKSQKQGLQILTNFLTYPFS